MTRRPEFIVRKIDELRLGVASLFKAARGIEPRDQFRLFYPILCGESMGALTALERHLWVPKTPYISESKRNDIFQNGQTLHKTLLELFEPTYFVTSYWSPIDRRRKSVGSRLKGKVTDEQRATAYAFAFFALTFAGIRAGGEITSAVQFTATQAFKPRGLTTYFLAGEPGTSCLRLPPESHFLLQKLGIHSLVESHIIERFSDTQIRALLQAYCDNYDDKALSDPTGFGGAAILTIESSLRDGGFTHPYIESAREYLDQFYRSRLSPLQVLSIVVTQLLWLEACPSNYMYTFVIEAPTTNCVLTLGRDRKLDDVQWLGAVEVAGSMFFHPLLRDYAVLETESEVNRSATTIRRLLGHNLPKLLITPGLTEIGTIQNSLELPEPNLACAQEAAKRLQRMFEHYEKILLLLGRLGNRSAFSEDVVPIALESFKDDLATAFELARSVQLNPLVREKLELLIVCPADLDLFGHRTYLAEILFNLIWNAVESIDPREFATMHPDTPAIVVSFASEPRQGGGAPLTVTVRDFGLGFSAEDMSRLEEKQRQIFQTGMSDFWRVLDELVAEALEKAHEEHMGFGLLFCLGYLRSLEWDPSYLSPGKLKVRPRAKGTELVIELPALRCAQTYTRAEPVK